MDTQVMKLSDIHPAEYNPRKILKPGDKEWDALVGSINEFGFVEPLVVNIKNHVLVGGHQRYNVLKAKGVEETEVVTVDLQEHEEKILNVALNRIEGLWDYEKLEVLFEEFSVEEIMKTGFSEAEISDIIHNIDLEENLQQDSGTEERESEAIDTPEEEPEEKPFQVYLSFSTQEAAEKWLTDRNIEKSFPNGSRNLNIRMEGIEYAID